MLVSCCMFGKTREVLLEMIPCRISRILKEELEIKSVVDMDLEVF